MFKKLFVALIALLALWVSAAAQELEVDRYNITARIDMAASALDLRASLAVTNQGPSRPKLYLQLTKLAKVSAVTVGGAAAQFEATELRSATALNQIIITPQAAIAAGAKATIEVSYRIEVAESTALASVYPGEVLMTPEAAWVPMPLTMFTYYGAMTAPFTLSITAQPGGNNFRAVSSGTLKSDGSNQTFTFEQPLNSLPFIVAGSFDQPAVFDHSGVKVELYTQPGLTVAGSGASAKDNLARLAEEASRILAFFTKMFGPLDARATFRIISSTRTGNVLVPGAIVLDEQVFRQDVLDAITIERLADAIARMWTAGRVRVRGQQSRSAQGDRPAQKARSAALLNDSLPRYLSALYFEDRFGKQSAQELFTRMRWAYTPVAQSGRDAPLELQTILLPSYSAAVFSKGPLVLRLLAETVGREKFIAALKQLFTGPQTKVVTIDDLRQALVKASGPEIDKLYQQWIESVIAPDIIIGIPQPSDKPGAQRINLRNLYQGDVTIQVLAITASGKQLTVPVTVPSEDITSVDIQTAEKITSVEADPEKLIIQTDYDNDKKPAEVSAQTLLNESIAAFNKGEHAQAEAKLRQAVRADPNNAMLHAWLARTLAAQNKTDEAVSEANAAIKANPPLASALAWAHITLGQVALARNQAAEAAAHLRRAVVETDEAPAQFAAREALARAYRAASNTASTDESIRGFFTQFDSLVKQPTSDKLFAVVNRNSLKRFVQGLTLTPPTAWTSEILGVDQIDASRVAVDVGLKVKADGRDQQGTAVFVLRRTANGWMLEEVRQFNVK